MSRRIAFDATANQVVVEFRYDPSLKEVVKALPGSSFDWSSKTWRFPPTRAGQVAAALEAHGFEVAPSAAELVGGVVVTSGAAPEREGSVDADALTVRALNAAIGSAISASFAAPVWVVGVIDGWSRTAGRRHAYFTLVDSEASPRGVEASVDAVMFAGARERVTAELSAAGLALTDGLKVKLRVRVEVYEARGRLQVIVEDVDATWSMGDLTLRREAVLRGIAERGLSDRQRSLPMPTLPLRVALLTSAGSDAYHDFMSSITASGYAFDVTALDVRVQGAALESTVLDALSWVRERAAAIDVVVITRGGGGRAELAHWDNLAVAIAVATLPVKVLVAIGHEQDQCALDHIAFSRKTPTEAAEHLVALINELDVELERAAERLRRAAEQRLSRRRDSLEGVAQRLAAGARLSMKSAWNQVRETMPRRVAERARARLRHDQARVATIGRRLTPARVRSVLTQRRATIDGLAARIARDGSGALSRSGAEVERLARTLTRAAHRPLGNQRRHIDSLDAQVRISDPVHVLRRGFAILRDSDGRLLPNAEGLEPGRAISVEMYSSTLDASVVGVRPNKREDNG